MLVRKSGLNIMFLIAVILLCLKSVQLKRFKNQSSLYFCLYFFMFSYLFDIEKNKSFKTK